MRKSIKVINHINSNDKITWYLNKCRNNIWKSLTMIHVKNSQTTKNEDSFLTREWLCTKIYSYDHNWKTLDTFYLQSLLQANNVREEKEIRGIMTGGGEKKLISRKCDYQHRRKFNTINRKYDHQHKNIK